MTDKMLPTLPFYGLNGSSPERYAEEFTDQIRALDTLVERMAVSDFPHGRDFQHFEGPTGFTYLLAKSEHNLRLDQLRRIRGELVALQEHACAEIDRRADARRVP